MAWAGVCALASLVFSRSVIATPAEVKAQCLGAYEQGQRQRKAGALLEAQATFTFCASQACPGALHDDCSRWLTEVEKATPKATFRVSNVRGEELHGARVSIDGAESQPLDGRPLKLDPGAHVATIERAEYRTQEQRFVVSEGETLALQVTIAPAVAPAAAPSTKHAPGEGPGSSRPEERRGVPSAPIWIGVGMGAVGAASFTYFGLKARAADRALESCAPSCDANEVHDIRRDYLLANLSLGVGALGLLGAGAWALFGPRTPDTGIPVVAQGLKLRIGPTTSISGTF